MEGRLTQRTIWNPKELKGVQCLRGAACDPISARCFGMNPLEAFLPVQMSAATCLDAPRLAFGAAVAAPPPEVDTAAGLTSIKLLSITRLRCIYTE